jgi:hypothetical protein
MRLRIPLFVALLVVGSSIGCGDGDIVFPGMVLPTTSPTGTVVSTETPTVNRSETPTPTPTEGGSATSTPTPMAECLEDGETCVLDADCCSESCEIVEGVGFACQ